VREIEELSAEQLAGQLLIVGFAGPRLPKPLGKLLKNRALGGAILFRRNLPDLESTWKLCTAIAEAAPSGLPPFIAVDQEGGRVARLREGVIRLPPLRAIGKADDLELSKRLATQQGAELRALGFNLNFSPVADVDSNPQNPIIGDRAFGSDAALVTRHCKGFLEGFADAGIMGCVKHFPGHGDTDSDSHLTLPTVRRGSLSLRQTELYPFERLAPVAPTMMTAHVVFEALDSVPATLSPRLCETLLRREFGFEGVLVSDDLEMAALAQSWSIEDSAVLAIRAGCDALLICSRRDLHERAQRALTRAIDRDSDFRQRCEQAAARSLTARRACAPMPPRFEALERLLHSDERRSLDARLQKLT
jgi:beta-N-acetylhexosaminidase